MKLGKELGLGPGHIVLDGDSAPPPHWGRAPNFGPCPLCLNGWLDQAATWYCLRWGPISPKGGGDSCPLLFGECIVAKGLDGSTWNNWYWGMPRPRPRCVRWGPSSPNPNPKSGTAHPRIFGPCLLWPNGWMDQDATWYEGRRRQALTLC